MSNVIFTYNEEAAMTAGQGGFINETGGYVLTVTEAALTTSQGGAKAIEFSGEADDGRKVQYLSVYVSKKDGSANTFGVNMIHAMMGCAGIKEITQQQVGDHMVAPEFSGKKLGLVLQKVLSSKQDGSDTYKFDIRLPFIAATRQTLQEKAGGKNAETVDRMIATLKDKDERKKSGSSQQDTGYHFGQDGDPGFSPF